MEMALAKLPDHLDQACALLSLEQSHPVATDTPAQPGSPLGDPSPSPDADLIELPSSPNTLSSGFSSFCSAEDGSVLKPSPDSASHNRFATAVVSAAEPQLAAGLVKDVTTSLTSYQKQPLEHLDSPTLPESPLSDRHDFAAIKDANVDFEKPHLHIEIPWPHEESAPVPVIFVKDEDSPLVNLPAGAQPLAPPLPIRSCPPSPQASSSSASLTCTTQLAPLQETLRENLPQPKPVIPRYNSAKGNSVVIPSRELPDPASLVPPPKPPRAHSTSALPPRKLPGRKPSPSFPSRKPPPSLPSRKPPPSVIPLPPNPARVVSSPVIPTSNAVILQESPSTTKRESSPITPATALSSVVDTETPAPLQCDKALEAPNQHSSRNSSASASLVLSPLPSPEAPLPAPSSNVTQPPGHEGHLRTISTISVSSQLHHASYPNQTLTTPYGPGGYPPQASPYHQQIMLDVPQPQFAPQAQYAPYPVYYLAPPPAEKPKSKKKKYFKRTMEGTHFVASIFEIAKALGD